MARQSGEKLTGSQEPQPVLEAWATSVLPRRESGAHKWGVGGVVVVAGSSTFAGAAALCCAGAARSGAGIVSAALPRAIVPVVVGLAPEVTVVILPEGDSAAVALRAAQAIDERLRRSGAMVIGPGLGNDETTAALLASLFGFVKTRGGIGFGPAGTRAAADVHDGFISAAAKPVVVDADALNWLSEQDRWWERVPGELLVLTPHVGEMARLVDGDVDEILADPAQAARDAVMRWGQTVVLKGSPTLVASLDGTIMSVDTPPSLATAGSGDVLSGAIGAFLAQGLSTSDAAGLAAFVGSRAAHRVARRFGTLGVVASDLPPAIAEELCALEGMGA